MRRRRSVIVAAMSVLVLAACGQAPSDTAASDAGITPRTFTVTTLAGPEHWQSLSFRAFTDAVTEASDGAFTFDYQYGAALIPPAEQARGIGDGAADLGYLYLGYTPADFPIDAWRAPAASQADPRPVVGRLQAAAASLEWSFTNDELLQEFETNDLVPLAQTMILESYDLICDEPVTDLASASGKTVRVGGQQWAAEAEALGMSPVFMTADELFDGLQRGVVDCYLGAANEMAGLGIWDIDRVKHFTSLASAGSDGYSAAFGRSTWDELTSEEQGLFLDAVPAYLGALFTNGIAQTANFYSTAPDKGIQFHQAPQVLEALGAHQQAAIDALPDTAPPGVADPAALMANYVELFAKWDGIVEGLGYVPAQATWPEWAAAGDTDVDLAPWLDSVTEEILTPARENFVSG